MRRPLLPLDPTWWRPVRGGYEQQDGRAKIRRILANGRPIRWELWIDDAYRGHWDLFSKAKGGAAGIPQAELENPPASVVAARTADAHAATEAT